MLLGGSRQVRNSVDAAVLNVNKRLVESKIQPQIEYQDCADSAGQISIANINRVWGKAYLIAANQEAMEKNGEGTANSMAAAKYNHQVAQAVNDTLVAKVKDETTLNRYYQDLAGNRSAPLLGENTGLTKEKDDLYQFAQMNRGGESNLKVASGQIPPGASQPELTSGYFKGYCPKTVNGQPFCFTSFAPGEMPHLVSDALFNQNREDVRPVADASRPVPNAIMASGVVSGARGALTASASGIANPQRTYELAIPHGYIALQFANVAQWFVDGKKRNQTVYGYEEETQLGVPNAKMYSGFRINGYASLGNEYKLPTLMAIIEKVPGDKDVALAKMVQRLKEVDPTFTMTRLEKLLKVPFQKQSPKYYIYPDYKTADHTNPTIKIGTVQDGLPGWLDPNTMSDGLEKEALKELTIKDEPNYCWFVPLGGGGGVKKWTELTGSFMWKPGTGGNNCLGEMRLSRTTRINFEDETLPKSP